MKYALKFINVATVLHSLFHRLFNNGEYPELWGKGIIVPIFKGGNIDDPNKYRGVCLINILGKIYSQVLLNRITKWLKLNEKLNDHQFGFQKGKSTADLFFYYIQ